MQFTLASPRRTRSTHADQQQGKRKEPAVHAERSLPADQQTSEVAQPGEAALHLIALPIVVFARDHGASTLGFPPCWTSLRRDTHADPATPQGSDETRYYHTRDPPRVCRGAVGRPRGRATKIVSRVCSASRTSATCALSRWKPNGSPLPSTTSIHLVPLPFLVRPTCSPPSWRARTSRRGRPWTNRACPAGRGRRAPLARCAPRRLPLPQRLSRRHTVVGAPYSRGRSCQRQPVMRM